VVGIKANVFVGGNINSVSSTKLVPNQINNLSICVQTQFDNLSAYTFPNAETGSLNYSLGTYNGILNTTGISIGVDKLDNNVTGCENIAIGDKSGSGVMGSNCVCIGTYSGLYSADTYCNSTCSGYQARITGSYRVALGTDQETVMIPGSAVQGSSVQRTWTLLEVIQY
jgi:hypothetical protein